MNNFFASIGDLFPTIVEHKYLVLLIVGTFEGFHTGIAAGVLVSLGLLSLWPALLTFFVAEIFGGFLWYGIGALGGARAIDWFVGQSPKRRALFEKIRQYLDLYTGRIVLIAKLTFSMTIATLIATGALRYNIKRYAVYNIIGSAGWAVLIMGIGYFLGESYELLVIPLGHLSMIIFGAFIVFVVFGLVRKFFGGAFSRTLSLFDVVAWARRGSMTVWRWFVGS